MTRTDKAIEFAAAAHSGVTRKASGIPYILHPLETAAIAATLTEDEDIIIAAILHDTIEDTSVTEAQIRENFGEQVLGIVLGCTEDKMKELPAEHTWQRRKEHTLAYLSSSAPQNVKIVMLADKLSNIRSLYSDYKKIGDAVFERFNQKDKFMHGWYYQGIISALSEFDGTYAYEELCNLVEKVFGGQFDL
ncbi:MAG: HD domain-containing protein [Oscillospiraceae bacterium]